MNAYDNLSTVTEISILWFINASAFVSVDKLHLKIKTNKIRSLELYVFANSFEKFYTQMQFKRYLVRYWHNIFADTS